MFSKLENVITHYYSYPMYPHFPFICLKIKIKIFDIHKGTIAPIDSRLSRCCATFQSNVSHSRLLIRIRGLRYETNTGPTFSQWPFIIRESTSERHREDASSTPVVVEGTIFSFYHRRTSGVCGEKIRARSASPSIGIDIFARCVKAPVNYGHNNAVPSTRRDTREGISVVLSVLERHISSRGSGQLAAPPWLYITLGTISKHGFDVLRRHIWNCD